MTDSRSKLKSSHRVIISVFLFTVVVHALIFGFNNPKYFYWITGESSRKNVIFMVSDGMGYASLSLVRALQRAQKTNHGVGSHLKKEELSIDEYLTGSSKTYSANNDITDSAAGATAFSCGQKTKNDQVAMLPNGKKCATVLEAAHDAGYLTGIVVSTAFYDATPASFACTTPSYFSTQYIQKKL